MSALKDLNTYLSYFILTLLVTPGLAQVPETELILNISSNEFDNGIAHGESGVLNINITNTGPNPISSLDILQVTLGYNVTQNLQLYDELLASTITDPSCAFIFNTASPPPPINNILFYHYYEIMADIAVGETYTCAIPVTFSQTGYLDTVWRLRYITPSGLVINDAPFIFKTQARPVSLNLNIYLVVGMLIMTGIFFRRNHT